MYGLSAGIGGVQRRTTGSNDVGYKERSRQVNLDKESHENDIVFPFTMAGHRGLRSHCASPALDPSGS